MCAYIEISLYFFLVADRNDPRHLNLVPVHLLPMIKTVLGFESTENVFNMQKIKSIASRARINFRFLERTAEVVEKWADQMLKLQHHMEETMDSSTLIK